MQLNSLDLKFIFGVDIFIGTLFDCSVLIFIIRAPSFKSYGGGRTWITTTAMFKLLNLVSHLNILVDISLSLCITLNINYSTGHHS